MNISKPTAQDIEVLASVAGLPVAPEVAARIANAMGPAFENFAIVAGTLPFDLEPATFTMVSLKCIGR